MITASNHTTSYSVLLCCGYHFFSLLCAVQFSSNSDELAVFSSSCCTRFHVMCPLRKLFDRFYVTNAHDGPVLPTNTLFLRVLWLSSPSITRRTYHSQKNFTYHLMLLKVSMAIYCPESYPSIECYETS